jgi:cytidyltransferase-like protein
MSSPLADHDTNDIQATLNDVKQLLSNTSDTLEELRHKTVPRVMMSGCVDLMHSGHIAAFAEAAKYGDLYVCLGSDKNIELLKHKPMIPENERLYMVQAIRHVHEARISKGTGDLDWLTEVTNIKPDIFFVNEDGDRKPKREACARLGIKYVVGKRLPAEGLQARSSTDLKKTIAAKTVEGEVLQPKQRPKLVYFDGRGRGDMVRFMLEAAGLHYDDIYLKSREQFLGLCKNGDLDFGQVPMLQLEEGNLVQVRNLSYRNYFMK